MQGKGRQAKTNNNKSQANVKQGRSSEGKPKQAAARLR